MPEIEEIADDAAEKGGAKKLVPIAQGRKKTRLFPEGVCAGITADWIALNLSSRGGHEFRRRATEDFDVFSASMMSLERLREKHADALALEKEIANLEGSVFSRWNKAEIAAKKQQLAKLGNSEGLRREWIDALVPSRRPDSHSRGKYHSLTKASHVFIDPGYYYLGMQPPSGLGHAIGLHVTPRRARLMDPNTSEYQFESDRVLLSFLPKYLDTLYRPYGFDTYQYYFFNDTAVQQAELADGALTPALPKGLRDLVVDYIY